MEIASWLACLGFLLWIGHSIDRAIARMRGQPPHPPNSQLESDQRDLKRRVKLLEDRMDSLFTKLDQDKNEILVAGQNRETYLGGKIGEINDRVDGVQTRLGEIPGEFMAMLVNAKNLYVGGK